MQLMHQNKNELGEPKENFKTGINKTISWYLNNRNC